MPILTWESLAKRARGSRPVVMAHRGAPDEAAENTLASFSLALEQGADVLETDLRFTRDNRIVLIHDATVERTTGQTGLVSDMTLAEVKRLRTRVPATHSLKARSMGKEEAPERVPSGEPPPTLEELLDLTRGQVPLALELKDDRFLSQSDASRLSELLEQKNALESSVLVSFSLARLLSCKSLAPKLRIGMITLSNPLPLYRTDFLGAFYPILFANPVYALWARRLGKIVCPLDTSPEPRLAYYRLLGVPVIMTNHPATTRRALDRFHS